MKTFEQVRNESNENRAPNLNIYIATNVFIP